MSIETANILALLATLIIGNAAAHSVRKCMLAAFDVIDIQYDERVGARLVWTIITSILAIASVLTIIVVVVITSFAIVS